jgi:hypothetical protein
MSLTQTCPLPAALTAIPESACPFRFDQISKIAFQQIQTSGFMTETTVLLKATWTALLAAVDATKIVLSPPINNLVLPPTEINAEGGNDNTTIGGVRNVKGLNMVTVTGQLLNISVATKLAMQALFDFSKAPAPGVTKLWAFFFTTDGRVIYKKVTTNCYGIDVYNVVTSDPGSEGFNANNVCNFSFDLLGGWADDIAYLTLTDFKAMTIQNPT